MDRLTDTVYQAKYNERVQRLLKSAKLRFPKADVHDIFYAEERGLERTTMNELATCSFVEENRSVIFQGYTSSGKTYLGCALLFIPQGACYKRTAGSSDSCVVFGKLSEGIPIGNGLGHA